MLRAPEVVILLFFILIAVILFRVACVVKKILKTHGKK